jgi:hypothetical protein
MTVPDRTDWPKLPEETVPVVIIALLRRNAPSPQLWVIGLGQTNDQALAAVMVSAKTCADYNRLKHLLECLKTALSNASPHHLQVTFSTSYWQVAIKWEVFA